MGVVLSLVFLSAPANAQVNAEKLRKETNGVSASVDGTFSVRSGNSDLVDLGSSGRIDYRDNNRYVFLVGRVSYGKNDGSTYSNASFGHLRFNQTLSKLVIAEAFGQLERDAFTLLQLRTLVGGGVRLRYVDTDGVKIVHGSTIMHETERLDPEKVEIHPDHVSTFRWSNYASIIGRISDVVVLSSTSYVQPRLDDFGDIRLINDSSVEVEINQNLSLITTLSLRYDSRPPDAIESTDLSVRNGLRVRL